MAELQVSVLSPAKAVAKLQAAQVQLPGALGYLGILPGHTRFVGELGIGELSVGTGSDSQRFFIAGGYVDVADDKVSILADIVEKAADIDVAAAERSRAEASERLAQKNSSDFEKDQTLVKMAEERLAVARGS